MKSSTSFPPSGSINPHEIRAFIRVLEAGWLGRVKLRGGMKRVFWVFGKDGDGIGVLRKREAIVAIEMGIKALCFSLFFICLGGESFGGLGCYNIWREREGVEGIFRNENFVGG